MRISDWSSDVCSSDLLVHEGACENMAVAGAMLERDAPLPAGIARGRAGKGRGRADRGGRHGDRAVDRQPVRPVLEPCPEFLLDQQAAEARAVEKQVAGDPLAAFERSEEHTSELQSLMRNSYAVFCLKNKN